VARVGLGVDALITTLRAGCIRRDGSARVVEDGEHEEVAGASVDHQSPEPDERSDDDTFF
jgi:hypothetical protein